MTTPTTQATATPNFTAMDAKQLKALAKQTKATQPKRGTLEYLAHMSRLSCKLHSNEFLADLVNNNRLFDIYLDMLFQVLHAHYGDKIGFKVCAPALSEFKLVAEKRLANNPHDHDIEPLRRFISGVSIWLEQ